MSAFTTIDLSTLPPPSVVETLDFEAILAAMLADLQARDPAFTALVESDPAYKILEVCAYRELLIRQRVNDAARATMLAYATGADLEQIGALFGVTRLTITEADEEAVPPVPAVMESDTDLRRRIQLALEGLSTAGPEGAYIFHALAADGDVLDAAASSPSPGNVVVTVMCRSVADGVPSSGLLDIVEVALNAEDVRPLTDNVTVQPVTVVNFTLTAELYTYPGPDPAVVTQAARDALEAYLESVRRIGKDVTVSGIYAALHQPGVQRVHLLNPNLDIEVEADEVSFCASYTVDHVGIVNE
jgi:phage-related baseplate assembly protein